VSDWVITVDRNLGVEFFDHGGRRDRPDYLIDHSPDVVSGGSRRLVVTSRSLEELEAMFRPVLLEHGLPADGACAGTLFDQLRFLSGRLGFKLISAGQQRREALGLALARLYLAYQCALSDQVVVPLDAHPGAV
jgi:DNA phosphorothioation-dependent restriction protein DptH